MHIIHFFALTMLSLTLAACASEQAYRVKQDRLKGLSETALISRLGAPTREYTMDNGSKALLYHLSKPGNEDTRSRQCDTTYVLDRSKRVADVTFVGRDCFSPDDEAAEYMNNGLPSFMVY